MVSASSLGKRTRSSKEPLLNLDVPVKRPRVQTRNFLINDENRDPAESLTPSTDLDEDVTSCSSRKNTSKPFALPLTPSAPRFRDALSKTPTTPRHRVMSVGKHSKRLTPLTPVTPAASQTVYHLARQLFSRSNDPGQLVGRDEEREQLRGFLTRCTSSTLHGCLYVSGPPGTGKSAMVNSVTQELVSNTTTAVRKAYINCMSIKSSSDLYATLLEQLDIGEEEASENDASASLHNLFVPKQKQKKRASGGASYLVVLDEVDHILTLDLESLYRVFEWSMQRSSRLILVGIANALDLTDRFLPRLKSRNLKPELLPFLPYTAPQIKNIITDRLRSLLPDNGSAATPPNFVPFFHPAALELCSRKVSSQTGDLRKAYEILRRSVDLVEAEMKRKLEDEAREKTLLMTPSKRPLGENTNLASSPEKKGTAAAVYPKRSASAEFAASLQALTVETAPRVSIGHLNKITAAVFSNGASQRLKGLNLQQKAALCSLMAMEKRNKAALAPASSSSSPSANATPPNTPPKPQSSSQSSQSSSSPRVTAPTVKTLFDAYCLLCRRDSLLHPLSSSEFREVVGSLETLSLVTAVDGRTGSFAVLQTPSKRGRKATFASGDERRVACCVGEKEVEQGVESGLGSDILRSILSGEALDYC